MPLCVCYSCGRKIDCSPDGVCDVCDDDGLTHQQTPIVVQASHGYEQPSLSNENWHLKCCHVGCRTLGVVMHSGEWWCGKHYNNMVRLNCIQKGCSHPIPEPM